MRTVYVCARVRVHNALLCLPRLSGKQDDTVPIAAMPYLSLQLHVNSTIMQQCVVVVVVLVLYWSGRPIPQGEFKVHQAL